MVTSPLSSGEWPSPENTPPSVGKTYTQLEIISFFAYHSKKDIVRAVKESGYGPSVTSLYRMFPSKNIMEFLPSMKLRKSSVVSVL